MSKNTTEQNPFIEGWDPEDRHRQYPRTSADEMFGCLLKFGDELEDEKNVVGRAHHQPDHDSPVVHEPSAQELSHGDNKQSEDVPETNVSLEYFRNLFKRKS